MMVERWDPATLLDPQAARQAGPELLSLLLIDARNVTLAWLDAFEVAQCLHGGEGVSTPQTTVPLRAIGQVGWAQEFWTARHVQRLQGETAAARTPRLASVHHRADDWFSPESGLPWDGLPPHELPDVNTVRQYLEQTLELTLDLLSAVPKGPAMRDEPWHVFRWAVLNEDRLCERLAVAACGWGVESKVSLAAVGPPPARAAREPLWMPARRFEVGSRPAGLVPPNERWAFEENIPEFEIDAQAVSWAALAEFAEDGGYDDPRWWTQAGWAFVQAQSRRAPRGVVQWQGGVWRERAGRVQRAPGSQAAAHVTWYEADAWCRWAGRRLPTEVEWEQAACTAASRGFVWGELWEWTLGAARWWPTWQRHPVAGFTVSDPDPQAKVLRGASSWTAPRAAHPKGRRFVLPQRDEGFFGFRSCAL